MTVEPIYAGVFPTAWGWAAVAASPRGLCGVLLPVRRTEAAAWAECLQPPGGRPADRRTARLMASVKRRMIDYFAGRPVDFHDVPVDLSACGPFARRVLTALAKVGYGRRVTYGDLAAAAGNRRAARAAGAACAANPTPLAIPCHRVVAADGGLGGFSAAGGVAAKRRMLALEARSTIRANSRLTGSKSGVSSEASCRSGGTAWGPAPDAGRQ
jgi:methylated-DNA-[protein]-cysteine S-methyltransferase